MIRLTYGAIMLIFLTAVGVVLIISFLCSIFESVLLSVTRPQIEVLGRRHARAASLLAGFKENIDVPIAAILILNTAAHTIGAAVAGASYSEVFDPATLWIFSIVFTLAVLLLTEIIPKTLGVSYATVIAAPVAHGIRLLTILLKPLVTVSEAISRSLRRDAVVPITSPEEIRLLAWLGHLRGAVGPLTAGMIVGATQLRHLDADDVMLPRDDVRFLSAEMSRDEALAYVRESGHSRFPFTPTGDFDDVSGVVLAKDLLYWLLQNDTAEIDWNTLQQDALVVPNSVALPQLLKTYQETQRHLAIVVDEYGSVEGIVTLEDVLEEIVGEIRDESDLPIEEFQDKTDGTLVVRGSVDMRKLCSRLGITWDPELEVSTISGLVTEALERIPVVGDTIDWDGYRIEVLRADRRRAKLLSVRALQEDEAPSP
jgi:CBS domain containing-hemolysin-like protein